MRGLKATIVAAATLGLVVGATVGGVAQDEPDADATAGFPASMRTMDA